MVYEAKAQFVLLLACKISLIWWHLYFFALVKSVSCCGQVRELNKNTGPQQKHGNSSFRNSSSILMQS